MSASSRRPVGAIALDDLDPAARGFVSESVGSTGWVGVTAFAFSLIGVGLSTYVTIAHFTEGDDPRVFGRR